MANVGKYTRLGPMGIHYPGLVKGFHGHGQSQELYLRKLTNGNGKSPFLKGDTSSHGCLSIVMLHRGRLTWNLTRHPWKRKIIFQTIIFRFYVNLRGCSFRGCGNNRSLLKNFIRKLLPSFWPPRKTNFNGYFWDSTGDGHQPVGIVEGLQRISDGRFIISIGCRWNLSVLTTQERTRSGQTGLLIIDYWL